jgi:hypothetical protein
VTEVLPHRQYRVVVDGSRHITLRNRRFLHKILPVCRQLEFTITPPTTTDRTDLPRPTLLEISEREAARLQLQHHPTSYAHPKR